MGEKILSIILWGVIASIIGGAVGALTSPTAGVITGLIIWGLATTILVWPEDSTYSGSGNSCSCSSDCSCRG